MSHPNIHNCSVRRAGAIVAAAFAVMVAVSVANAQQPDVGKTAEAEIIGTLPLPAFDLPLSDLLSPESHAVLKRSQKELDELRELCPGLDAPENAREIVVGRACVNRHYFPRLIERHRARYKVTIKEWIVDGVATEIFTPVEGVSAANRHRVLINVHGGSFLYGGRWGGQVESIPIAALGKIKIVSVDYRMAPEHHFPAASEDLAVVYRALLAEYRPENIGIYGCSAGAFITAESVAWFKKEGLPRPGAIGMFCGGGLRGGGDSARLGQAIAKARGMSSSAVNPSLSYFRAGDHSNALAWPAISNETLAQFPPTLLISSIRDPLLSSVVLTHTRLVKLHVSAELHIWEGLDHAFLFEPDLPESREAYDVIVRFFDVNLRGKDVPGDSGGDRGSS